MGEMFDNLQHRLKGASAGFFLSTYRLLFGAFLGLTLALIGERVMGFGDLSFALVIITPMLGFYRLTQTWTVVPVLVFSLICILVGLLLRMYILVAPGH